MEDICYPILSENNVKQRSIFIVNDRLQVVFITDLKTGKKLDDDYNVNEYLRAVVQANLLKSHGVYDADQIVTIIRSEEIDDYKTSVVIALDVVTNEEDGVDELRCVISEEGLYSETEEVSSLENASLWNQQVPDFSESESQDSLGRSSEIVEGPTLRWNSEMTTQLIEIRGDMDGDFSKAKYKFRLWELVATKLNQILPNVKVTAKDCDDKWRNIVATYRKNVDKIKCCGDNTIRWEYFTAMDKILQGTKELLTNEQSQNSVSDETMTNLMCSLNPVEIDIEDPRMDISCISDTSSCHEEIEIEDLNETPQDCVITRNSNEERRKWTTEQCLTLIHLRKQMESKFKQSYDKSPNFWREIASQMNIHFLSDFTAGELESVWNHFNISYEINLENLKSKGVNSISWKYFAIMDEVRGGTREIAELCVPRPGESLLKEFQKISRKSPTLSQTCISKSTTVDETDSEDASSFNVSGITWTQEMVKVLISLKKVIEQDIGKHKIPRKKQWGIMVRRFRALKNVNITEEACEEKWRNLARTYKKNLFRVKKRGLGVIRWPYFWRMHEILGHSIMENEKNLTDPLANKSTLVETVSVPVISTLPMSERIVIADQDETVLDLTGEDSFNIINDFKEKQDRMLRETMDRQNEKIEQLHREQLNIKTLLMQLLQKFP